jgi:hypothetical protein
MKFYINHALLKQDVLNLSIVRPTLNYREEFYKWCDQNYIFRDDGNLLKKFIYKYFPKQNANEKHVGNILYSFYCNCKRDEFRETLIKNIKYPLRSSSCYFEGYACIELSDLKREKIYVPFPFPILKEYDYSFVEYLDLPTTFKYEVADKDFEFTTDVIIIPVFDWVLRLLK